MRFLCDEHVGVPVCRALVEAGYDVVHLLGLGLGGTSDPRVPELAHDQGRILLTRNYKDFAPLAEVWSRKGTAFPGILFIAKSVPQSDPGAHVRALTASVEAAAEGGRRIEGAYGWLR